MARADSCPRRRWPPAVCLQVICAFSAWLSFCSSSLAQPSSLPREDFWVPDGEVNVVVETNGVVYVGGQFDYVGPVLTTGGAFDSVSANEILDFPKANGAVKAIQSDPAGG